MPRPTQLTQKDIEDWVQKFNEQIKAPDVYRPCCSCREEHCVNWMADGVQCESCFQKQIPIYNTEPVKDAYLRIDAPT
jgi:hypothetical protein